MTPVPTAPTNPAPVGTGQPIDKLICPDRPDRPDRNGHIGGGRRKSLSGLVQRLRKNRDDISTLETRHVHTPLSQHSFSDIHTSVEVGTVGAVGTLNETRALDPEEWSGQGSGQSGQPPPGLMDSVGELTSWLREEIDAKPPQPAAGTITPVDLPAVTDADWAALEASFRPSADSIDAWGLTEAERAEGLARVRATKTPSCQVGDLNDVDPIAWGVPQSIPHDVMMAGLLAASRIRAPTAPVIQPQVAQSADPWAAGVADLQRMAPLDGFTSAQWAQIGRYAADLLRTHGADMHRLEWNAADAFGLHPDVLGRAVRAWGLAFLLDGGRVVDMTAAGAVIERLNGVRQSFTRRSGNGAVPAWEMSIWRSNPARAELPAPLVDVTSL